MKKSVFVIALSIILTMIIFSGCQEQNTDVGTTFEGISLESSIVELVNASLDPHRNKANIIDRVDVGYLFHNVAGRDITVNVTVEFYDTDDNILATGGPKYISLLKDYTEQGFGPANIISYDGNNVALIDHVKIIAVEE